MLGFATSVDGLILHYAAWHSRAEVTHSRHEEVTHGSDPRWVTSAANNRKSRAALAQFIIVFLLALLIIKHIPVDTISPLQSTHPS